MQEVSRKMDKKSNLEFVIHEIDFLNSLLEPWKKRMGDDYLGYKNHVLRMLNFCFYLGDYTTEEKNKMIIAAAFHDIGIWSGDAPNVDYIDPSVEVARDYLIENGYGEDEKVLLMISEHHKMSEYKDDPMVEIFRKADLVDFSLGLVRFGVEKDFIKAVRTELPNAGFHKRLAELTLNRIGSHPFKNPFPMMKK